jgi:hypothetical protein
VWIRLSTVPPGTIVVSGNISSLPFTTAYYFPSLDAPPADHILTIPLQTIHYTMVPDTMVLTPGLLRLAKPPIGTPLSARFTPTLLPGYHVLSASIPSPTQITSGTPGGSTPSGHHLPGFIPTLPPPPFEDLFHPLSEALILVAPSHLSHLITRFLLVDNFTKEAKLNPLLQDESQLGHNPRLKGNPHQPHPMDKTYLHPWPSIGIILYNIILNRLGGNNLKLTPSYP